MRVEALKSRSIVGTRKGISLIETLFAVGILMVGMLGIAAVLSVAGKNAVDSQTLASSQVLANSCLNDMYARNIQNPANWVQPVFNSMTNAWEWHAMGMASPQNSPDSSYCIDPLIFSFSPNISVPDSKYTLRNFPYYNTTTNAFVDPSISVSAGAGHIWGVMPRMLRVSVGSPGFPATGKLAEEIFASHNEIAEIKSRDSTRHVVRGFESVGTSLQKTATRQDYSWFATLTPKENNSSSYSSQYILSIVVVKKRDRVLDIPVPSAAGVGDPRALPSGEIMAWVVPLNTGSVPAAGFNGGGGGRVLLVGSAATESHTSAGQWIMLSRFDAGLGRGVFSWYRIATCDQEARYMNVDQIPTEYGVSGFNRPFGAGNGMIPVWVREVTLSGRDWGMFPATGTGFDNQVSIATIVDGAVNVHERVITLDEN
jgi:type II secretory pathway pseudopilin PulG